LTRKLEIKIGIGIGIGISIGIGIGIGIDGIVNENPNMGSIKRIVIEWAQRICSERKERNCSGRVG
jgi:hypothetical protein